MLITTVPQGGKKHSNFINRKFKEKHTEVQKYTDWLPSNFWEMAE